MKATGPVLERENACRNVSLSAHVSSLYTSTERDEIRGATKPEKNSYNTKQASVDTL